MAPVGLAPPGGRRHRQVHRSARTPRSSPTTAGDVAAGSGRDGPGRRRRLPAHRLLQGPREVGRHVHHLRGQALLRSRATSPTVEADGRLTLLGRGSVVHQHRRREGLPGGGRGGPQDPPAGGRRRRRGRARREVRRGHHRRRRSCVAGPAARRRRAHRPREGQAGRATRRPAACSTIDTIGRAPNGKVDYKRLKAFATDTLGTSQTPYASGVPTSNPRSVRQGLRTGRLGWPPPPGADPARARHRLGAGPPPATRRRP